MDSESPDHGGKKVCNEKTPQQAAFNAQDEVRHKRRSSGASKRLFSAPKEDEGAVVKVSNLPPIFLEVMPSDL